MISTIIEQFKLSGDVNGIPVLSNQEWKDLRSKYDKNDIKTALSEYIHSNNIQFPHVDTSIEEVANMFREFYSRSHLDWLTSVSTELVNEKFDYKYKYKDNPLGIINKMARYNICANYFQEKNRFACGSDTGPSPLDIWHDLDKLKRMNWNLFWSDGFLGKTGMCPSTIRSIFRLGTYTASQFKPSVVKFLYEYHNAKNVLDTSCGWGDRLCGFYGTPGTELYVGCDPNPAAWEVYKTQCEHYETWLGYKPKFTITDDYFECKGSKTVKIWRKASEDVDWSLYTDTFDFYFTSPPYFAMELYGDGTDSASDQSWSRYPTFESWKYDFFFKVTSDVWKTIKHGGYMMINIIEPSKKGKRLPLCDDMVDTFSQFEGCTYNGKIGMRLSARPGTKYVKDCLIEPIWVFTKGTSYNIDNADIGLEAFM